MVESERTRWGSREGSEGDRTWKHADQYFRGLLRAPRHKTTTGLATRMNANQERLERFVRESPWEYEAVEAHLRNAAPEAFQGPEAALIVDGMGIPKKEIPALVSISNGVGPRANSTSAR